MLELREGGIDDGGSFVEYRTHESRRLATAPPTSGLTHEALP